MNRFGLGRGRWREVLSAGIALLRTFVPLRRSGLHLLSFFFGGYPILRVRGEFRAGYRFRTQVDQFRPAISVDRGASLTFGEDCFVNQGAMIHAAQRITIGDRVLIGDLAAISDTDFHSVTGNGEPRISPVVIEDDVWIARGVIVLPGVTIGRGAVVGAGAVVSRDVPGGSVVVGNPAREIRTFEVDSAFRRA
jgi:acetyltransferase-like isoleucine patch superfamily enzyme